LTLLIIILDQVFQGLKDFNYILSLNNFLVLSRIDYKFHILGYDLNFIESLLRDLKVWHEVSHLLMSVFELFHFRTSDKFIWLSLLLLKRSRSSLTKNLKLFILLRSRVPHQKPRQSLLFLSLDQLSLFQQGQNMFSFLFLFFNNLISTDDHIENCLEWIYRD
jgi:hypothetical protein